MGGDRTGWGARVSGCRQTRGICTPLHSSRRLAHWPPLADAAGRVFPGGFSERLAGHAGMHKPAGSAAQKALDRFSDNSVAQCIGFGLDPLPTVAARDGVFQGELSQILEDGSGGRLNVPTRPPTVSPASSACGAECNPPTPKEPRPAANPPRPGAPFPAHPHDQTSPRGGAPHRSGPPAAHAARTPGIAQPFRSSAFASPPLARSLLPRPATAIVRQDLNPKRNRRGSALDGRPVVAGHWHGPPRFGSIRPWPSVRAAVVGIPPNTYNHGGIRDMA